MHAERDITTLETAFAALSPSPSDTGTIELIVRRPDIDQREVIDSAELDTEVGLIGDNWQARPSRHTDDGSAHPDCQITLMNRDVIQIIEADKSRWALAGDNFYVDFDLSQDNLPAGQRVQVGTAILEISEIPHTGCGKFSARYGSAAVRFVNSKAGRAARHRGVNARIIQNGTVKTGDSITKID